jgi:hypothetical protein
MIFSLCLGIIGYLPVFFIGSTKSRKSALGVWEYEPPIQYDILPSRHENCIKSIVGRNVRKYE